MYVHILGDSEATVWGLGGRERLRRMAGASGARPLEAGAAAPDDAPLLVLRGDHHFDPRVIEALVAAGDALVLYAGRGGPVVAARGAGRDRQALMAAVEAGAADGLRGASRALPGDLVASFTDRLRSHAQPRVLPITATDREWLERELFADAYKGVTDLVTKWLWPAPARLVTQWAVALGLHPNHVTVASLVLAVAAGILFYQGSFAAGLVAAWVMTFLDTVDGKLARVTVTSSRLGDVLDHGLDLVHPPFWYLAWGLGLAVPWGLVPDLETALWLIFAGYLGGRLCEGAFQLWCAPFSVFVWRPFDSFNRLVTARRNPNLILLTAGWAAGRPDLGLWAVMVWHLLSTVVLAARVVVAGWRRRQGPLASWLSEVGPGRRGQGLAVRTFTRLGSRA